MKIYKSFSLSVYNLKCYKLLQVTILAPFSFVNKNKLKETCVKIGRVLITKRGRKKKGNAKIKRYRDNSGEINVVSSDMSAVFVSFFYFFSNLPINFKRKIVER